MADNIIQLASQYLTPDMIAKLAGVLGESNSSTGSLVSAAAPMLLAGMAGSHAPSGMDMLIKAMAPTGAASPSVLDGLGGTMAALASTGAGSNSLVQTGSSLLGGMFGDKTSLMTKALSAFSGAKPGSASTVLSLLTPMLVGVIGKSLAGSGQATTPAAVTALLSTLGVPPSSVKGCRHEGAGQGLDGNGLRRHPGNHRPPRRRRRQRRRRC
jgi:hypothetical protein